ncbi:helix-turn-helix domain-containing protein [Frondihabitans sp. VKM Ac-2883]|uniref:helix-turn-helix domain-containing protein n=1 Tax=Frondihabitans sp. VKM Ac-2883 TaxID=2783823 RepID=UPI00188AD84C|nr:helix-turn-helix domain-containing protein [Frondihabitans sp. VKM Ac-2883]MBF4574714.1 helix-turn-helix domain-containing protein [Frondihabitans sp. VKM Ac-2883]
MTNTATRMVPEQDAYSVKQAAVRLGRSEGFVRKLINAKKLKALSDEGSLYVLPSEIDRYLSNLENARP